MREAEASSWGAVWCYNAIRRSAALNQSRVITLHAEGDGPVCVVVLNPQSHRLAVHYRGQARGEFILITREEDREGIGGRIDHFGSTGIPRGQLASTLSSHQVVPVTSGICAEDLRRQLVAPEQLVFNWLQMHCTIAMG